MYFTLIQRADFGTENPYLTKVPPKSINMGQWINDIKHENPALRTNVFNMEQNYNESDSLNDINVQDLKHSDGEEDTGVQGGISIKEELDTFLYDNNLSDEKIISSVTDQQNIPGELESKERSEGKGVKEKCRFCEQMFSQKKDRLRHEKEVHGKSRPGIKCVFCSQTFQSKSLIRKHHNEEHPEEENPYIKPAANYVECTICGKKLKETQLAVHMNRHADPEYKKGTSHELCSTCGKSVSTKAIAKHLDRCQKRLLNQDERKHKTKWHNAKVLCTVCGSVGNSL